MHMHYPIAIEPGDNQRAAHSGLAANADFKG